MSIAICINCLNKISYLYRIERWSQAKCNRCGCKGKNLLVSEIKPLCEMPCVHPDGCEGSEIKWICKQSPAVCPLATNQ